MSPTSVSAIDRLYNVVTHRSQWLRQELVWAALPRARWLAHAQARRWIFVNGCNRSGKTTLSNLLRHHPSVSVIGNANSKTRALPNSETLGCRHAWAERLDVFHRTETSDRSPATRLAFDWLALADPANEIIVVESDLPAVQMRWLQGIFSDSYFIGVVRNAYAVAAALRLKEGYAIDRCARQWARSNETMLADAPFVRNFHLVRYEDFVARPLEVTEKISGFAGLDQEPLRTIVKVGWRLGNTDTRPSTLRNANPELISALTAEDRALIATHASAVLVNLGYSEAVPDERA